MKRLKLLFLSLLLAVTVHAEEQCALVIRSSYSSGADSTGLKELSVLLLQGWTVASTTPGSGNDSMSSFWLVILKK